MERRHQFNFLQRAAFLLIICIAYVTDAGFLYGEPCSSRNTLEIYRNGHNNPQYIQCVDITRSNRTPNFKYYMRAIANATTLYADHMTAHRVPLELVASMRHLELIDLSNNRLRMIRPLAFAHLKQLRTLQLSDNQLTLRKNRPFLVSHTLTTLVLARNAIKELQPLVFTKLPNLKALLLEGNYLQMVSGEALAPLRRLQYLNLEDNYVDEVPEDVRRHVHVIGLNKNELYSSK